MSSQDQPFDRTDTRIIHSVARDVARVGGQAAARLFRSSQVAVETKKDNTPVTIADKRAEDTMRTLIREIFPDHAILGEERGHGDENEHSRWQWILDPIDGTKSFIRGVPLFTTLIGVLYDGNPVAGVIYNPITGEMASAGTGIGAYDEFQNRIAVGGVSDLSEAWVTLTDPADLQRRHPGLTGALAGSCRAMRTWADGYGYLLLARGDIDVMLDPIMHPWDVAPLSVVIPEAGGTLTDFKGSTEKILPDSVIATATSELHEQVRSLIGQFPGP